MKSRSYFFSRSALMSSCAVLAFAGASHQAQAQTIYQWNGSPTASTAWTTTANWTGSTIGASNASFNARLNVYNGSGQALTYSSAQGATVYANATGRGLVKSFQALSARFTAGRASRATNWPWPSFGTTLPSLNPTWPRLSVKRGRPTTF